MNSRVPAIPAATASSPDVDVAPPPLLRLLADGAVHSGEWLARQLGVSRAAVWKGMERLRAQGIEIEALARRGYRLPQPAELLDVEHIRAHIAAGRAQRLQSLSVQFEVDSTNSRLLIAPAPTYGHAHVLLCELQTAGRGRRGRRWIAPFGASLALSLGWAFADAPRTLPSLSLGVGVALVRALARVGARGLALKWPNDIWFNDRKIGGVLIELRAESGGPAYVVIGIGLNVSLLSPIRDAIEAAGRESGGVAVAALADACGRVPSRNAVAGAMVDELLAMLMEFAATGFEALHMEWSALDAIRGRAASVVIGNETLSGVARGVDGDGALLLEIGGQVRRFVSGEVSVRLTEGAE